MKGIGDLGLDPKNPIAAFSGRPPEAGNVPKPSGALHLLWAPCQATALVLDEASGEQRVLSLGSALVSGKCS